MNGLKKKKSICRMVIIIVIIDDEREHWYKIGNGPWLDLVAVSKLINASVWCYIRTFIYFSIKIDNVVWYSTYLFGCCRNATYQWTSWLLVNNFFLKNNQILLIYFYSGQIVFLRLLIHLIYRHLSLPCFWLYMEVFGRIIWVNLMIVIRHF